MTLLVFTRMLCEISMYFTVTAVLNKAFGFDANYFVIAAILLGLYMVSYFFRNNKVLRCLPALGCFSVILFVSAPGALILIGPLCVYVALTFITERFYQDFYRFFTVYKAGLAVSVVVFVICLVGSWLDLLVSYTMPWMFMFLVTGILTMRMLRQTESVLEEKKFMMMNLILLIIVCAVGIVLGSKIFLGLMSGFIGLIYKYVIAPVLTAAAYIMAGLLWVLSLIKFRKREDKEENPYEVVIEEPDEEKEQLMKPVDLYNLLLGLAIIIIGIVLFFVFRSMLGKRHKSEAEEGLNETRTPSSGKVENEGLLGLVPRNARDAVRFYYRKFERICASRGLKILPWYNTTDIRMMAATTFTEEPLDELRDVYVAARYDLETEVTKDQVQTAKNMVKQLKSQQKEMEKVERAAYKENQK